MADSTFILVGYLVDLETYYGENSVGTPDGLTDGKQKEDEKLHAMCVLINNRPEYGGVHDIVVVPEATKSAWFCIQQNIPSFVTGHIKTYNRRVMLVATYVAAYHPSDAAMRTRYSHIQKWSLAETPVQVDPLRQVFGFWHNMDWLKWDFERKILLDRSGQDKIE